MAEPHTRLFSLSLHAALIGAVSAGLVLALRAAMESVQAGFLPGGVIGNYEALPGWARFALPVATGLVLGAGFALLPNHLRSVGVVHVLDRLRYSRPRELPVVNAVVQFLAAVVAVAGGHSVDREGPGVHIGATTGNLLARHSDSQPEENLTLTACGSAAAIAAAFNTPLAGTIFAVEVLLYRYSVPRFIPVAIAAVIGAVLGRMVYGPQPAFSVPPIDLATFWELPWLVLLGIGAGLAAALFSAACGAVRRRTFHWSPLLAFPVAGAATGLVAQLVPQVMGMSYDTLQAMLHERFALLALLGILAAKLATTALAIGLRVPGGLIGPTLVMGGAIGALVGLMAETWAAFTIGSPGLYAMVGMVALMGAALRAPLSALLALLELTGNPNILLPGLLAVAAAELAASPLLERASVFDILLLVQRKGMGPAS